MAMTARAEHARILEAFGRFGSNAPAILCHDDADGLSAGAIFARAIALENAEPPHVRIVGRGASAWSPAMRDELVRLAPGGIVLMLASCMEGDGYNLEDIPELAEARNSLAPSC